MATVASCKVAISIVVATEQKNRMVRKTAVWDMQAVTRFVRTDHASLAICAREREGAGKLFRKQARECLNHSFENSVAGGI